MKLSQIASEVFVYALAIIVVGLILVFGYKKIIDVKNAGDDISIIQFKKQLESTISSASGSGNILIEDFILPIGFSKICFIDLNNEIPLATSNPPTGLPIIIFSSWKDKVRKNIFLLKGSKIEQYYIDKDKIGISDNTGTLCTSWDNCYTCKDVTNGKVSITFIGKGKKTLISR